MPELPEVETVVRSITPHVLGRTIVEASLTSHRVTRSDRSATAKALTGAVIQEVRRHGKQIFFKLDRGTLYIHLGMTGKLLWDVLPGKYARAVFVLDNGGTLVYDDVRQFGRVEYHASLPPAFEKVGPDALQLDFPAFYARLKKHHTAIKALLLNQSFISGIGNIYADESLFAARIHPRTQAGKISKRRAEALFSAIQAVLQSAIAHRGSSISDYVDAAGERGSFQQLHSVYGRREKPCPQCGKPIKRIILAQRSTHYCPRCQRV